MVAKAAPKKRATLEQLLGKKPRTTTVDVTVGTDTLTLEFRALGAKAYDELMAAHPPTKEQKAEGQVWNPVTFPAALIAASSHDPTITPEQATELWTSPDWARGELWDMLARLVALNQEGLDVPFT